MGFFLTNKTAKSYSYWRDYASLNAPFLTKFDRKRKKRLNFLYYITFYFIFGPRVKFMSTIIDLQHNHLICLYIKRILRKKLQKYEHNEAKFHSREF